MALETERSLTECRFEVSQLRKEVSFLGANRRDLESALGAVNEEKRMLERELLAIRSQLQLRAKVPLPTSGTLRQGVETTLRHGDPYFNS